MELYKTFLLQIKPICAYFQHPEVVLLPNLPQIRNWHGNATDIRGANAHVPGVIQYAYTARTFHRLNGLANTAMLNEVKLRIFRSENLSSVCITCGSLDAYVWGAKSHSTYVVDI